MFTRNQNFINPSDHFFSHIFFSNLWTVRSKSWRMEKYKLWIYSFRSQHICWFFFRHERSIDDKIDAEWTEIVILFIKSMLNFCWFDFNCSGKFNIFKTVFQRFMRLSPSVAAMILFDNYLANYLKQDDPQTFLNYSVTPCSKFWWSALLHLQVYVNPHEMVSEINYFIVQSS